MPARVIDTAYVEFLPDFSAIVAAQTDIDQHMAGIATAADEAAATATASFDGMASDAAAAFTEAATAVGDSMAEIAASAEEAGTATGEALTAGADEAGTAYEEMATKAKTSMDEVAAKATETSDGMGAKFSAMGGMMSMALGGAALAGVAGLGKIAQSGLSSAAHIEQVQIQFESLTGSVQAGMKQYQDLQNLAAVTPFRFQDLTTAAARFDAIAGSVGMARDQLIPFITTVGDVVATTGGGAQQFDTISLALSHMASTGKLTLQDVNMLSNALPGFSGVAAIAAAKGITGAQAMQEISKGAIHANEGMKDLLLGMQNFNGAAGAMARHAETLNGVYSTFKDTVAIALTNAFQSTIPLVKNALVQITPIIGTALNQIGPALGTILSSTLPILAQAIAALSPPLTVVLNVVSSLLTAIGGSTAIQDLGNAFAQLLTPLAPLGPIIGHLLVTLLSAITPLVTAFAPLIQALVTLLVDILPPLEPVITEVANVLVAILGPSFGFIAKIITELAPIFGVLVETVGTMLMPILTALEPIVGAILDAFMPLLPVIVQLVDPLIEIVTAFTPLIDLIATLLTTLTPLIVLFAKFDAWLISLLANKVIVPLILLLADALVKLLTPLMGVVTWLNGMDWGKVGKDIGNAFVDAWHAVEHFFSDIGDWFSALPGKVAGFFIGVWNAIHDANVKIRDGLINWAKGIPDDLLNAFHPMLDKIGGFFKGLWDGAKKTASDAIDAIVTFWTGLPGKLGGFAGQVGSDIVDFFKRALNGTIDVLNDGLRVLDKIPGVSIPEIPHLAHGGVAFGPALIGEDPSTAPEVALPLNDQRAMTMLAQAVQQALGKNGATSGNVTVYVTIDGQQLQARIDKTVDDNNRELLRTVR